MSATLSVNIAQMSHISAVYVLNNDFCSCQKCLNVHESWNVLLSTLLDILTLGYISLADAVLLCKCIVSVGPFNS